MTFRKTIIYILLSLLPGFLLIKAATAQSLRVSTNGRFLEQADGSPFFYLGDTAWELFHRTTRAEAEEYLQDRAGKGFTVIQAVVLAELDGLDSPNRYMHTPLIDNDPQQLNEPYFEHVDYIVNRAAELGIYMGLLPSWGDKFNKKWGAGPEIFTPENARTFGELLGKRYKNKPVIWILGGDRNPENEQHMAIVRAMAEGIRQGNGGTQLMTYHPMGRSNSSTFFHQDEWLSFNMFQSGHATANSANYEYNLTNYTLSPAKPTIDGEPRYEDHPIRQDPDGGWFNEFDVRQAAYWSMLSGAMGHTYGNHNIWQLWQPDREPITNARTPWQEALDHPGATQMGYMRRLFESRPWQTLIPDQSIIMSDVGDGVEHIRAARADKGSFLFIYTPTGKEIAVDMAMVSGSQAVAWWFNPRSGAVALIGKFPNKKTIMEFDPPGMEDPGNDWVLVIDDASRRFSSPGAMSGKKNKR